jgi:two-component system sensor histidine kinase/response regulator
MPLVHQPSILIVDDDEANATLAKEILCEKFEQIEICTKSEEALDTIESMIPDILLLDINMPNVPGTSILSKTRPKHPNMAILIISGVMDIKAAQKCMHLGANEYVTKPYESEQLVDAVIFWWRKMQQITELATVQAAAEFAHDLGNPLATMQVALYALTMELKNPDEKVKHALQALQSSTDYAFLLSRAWREIGSQICQHEQIQIRDLIENLHATFFSKIPLTINGRQDETWYSNQVGLQRVFQNLFQNSLEANPNTTVEIDLVRMDHNHQMRICYRDTGPGMTVEQVRNFNDRGKLDTTKPTGTGLGLNIISRIVHALGGTVHLTPRDTGVQFDIFLPAP